MVVLGCKFHLLPIRVKQELSFWSNPVCWKLRGCYGSLHQPGEHLSVCIDSIWWVGFPRRDGAWITPWGHSSSMGSPKTRKMIISRLRAAAASSFGLPKASFHFLSTDVLWVLLRAGNALTPMTTSATISSCHHSSHRAWWAGLPHRDWAWATPWGHSSIVSSPTTGKAIMSWLRTATSSSYGYPRACSHFWCTVVLWMLMWVRDVLALVCRSGITSSCGGAGCCSWSYNRNLFFFSFQKESLAHLIWDLPLMPKPETQTGQSIHNN